MSTAEPTSERWILIRGARQLLTLQGGTGPRRGRAMNQLEVIPNGAVLIRNGVVQCVGPAPRVENLAEAKRAIEIDASGKIVMPAFVESDASVHTFLEETQDATARSLRTYSQKKLTGNGVANASEYARYGTLTAGVPSLHAGDLKTLLKLLTMQKSMQSKPLRLRAILSTAGAGPLARKWMSVVREKKLCSIVEVQSEEDARSAAESGFALRLRSTCGEAHRIVELAQNAGAIAVLTAPCAKTMQYSLQCRSNTVFVVSPDLGSADTNIASAPALREMIDANVPFALSMGFSNGNIQTRNMQHLLFTATQHLGMTPEEAITAVTINAACALRAAHITGSLEPGKSADLLLMDVPDYREIARKPGMSHVELAMRGGQTVYRRAPLMFD